MNVKNDHALDAHESPFDRLLKRLEGVTGTGSQRMALCPAHDDQKPSLSVSQGDDGRALLRCHAGCPTEAVVEKLGLNMSDLFPRSDRSSYSLAEFAGDKRLPKQLLRLAGIKTARQKSGRRYLKIPYRSADGLVVAVRCRTRDRHWWGPGATVQPYGLDHLAAAAPEEPVLIVEGESDVLTCRHHEVLAVGIPGASTWDPEYAKLLEGRPVYIWREPDQAGHRLAAAVTATIPNVLVIDPPAGIKDASALHLDDPPRFTERLEALKQAAAIALPPGVRCVADALANPEARRGPRSIVPNLAWEARVSMLAAREKLGKSTLATGAGVAVSDGTSFLGADCVQGTVLWLLLEEHEADLLDRVQRFGGRGEAFLYTFRPPASLEELETVANQIRPRLLVVDTLPALAQRYITEAGSSAQWTPVMTAIARIARTAGTAVLLLHHGKKTDGKYRDSTAIGAGVDMILEMEPAKNAPRVRNITARGRWPQEKFCVVYDGVRYSLVGEEPDKRARAMAHIGRHPRSGMRDVRKAIGGRGTEADAIVRQLEAEGRIKNVGTEKYPKYIVVSRVPPRQEQRDTPEENVSQNIPHGGDTRTHPHDDDTEEIFKFEIPADVDLYRPERARR